MRNIAVYFSNFKYFWDGCGGGRGEEEMGLSPREVTVSRFLLADCYDWVEIFGSASAEVCWGWAHWESSVRYVGS